MLILNICNTLKLDIDIDVDFNIEIINEGISIDIKTVFPNSKVGAPLRRQRVGRGLRGCVGCGAGYLAPFMGSGIGSLGH